MTSSPYPKPVALVVGASRGIGRQVAIDLAKNGYAVVVAAKSTSDADGSSAPFPPDPNSPQSTISTVEREVRASGGEATAVVVDVRDPDSIERLVGTTVEKYGRLDALIYNSGAIWWSSVSSTPLRRFQLMQRVNPEGLYATVQAALPHLKAAPSGRGRIVVVSPPIYSRFFRGKTAYAMGKVGMSVLTVGLGMDLVREGLVAGERGEVPNVRTTTAAAVAEGQGEREAEVDMAVTSIWPAVAIESAATARITRADPAEARDLRRATVFSDAILAMLAAPGRDVNGRLELDEDFLRRHCGVEDFDKYSVVPGSKPRRIMPAEFPDLGVAEQADEGRRYDSAKPRAKM